MKMVFISCINVMHWQVIFIMKPH